MTKTELDILADQFVDKLRTVAVDALLAKGVTTETLDADLLASLLKQAVSPALDEGMKDAREAVEAGLGSWASATFFGSAGKAGAEVAKKYLEMKA